MHFGKAGAASEGSSEHDILLDDLSLPPNPVTGSSSVIIGVSTSHGKHPSDSDVRLVPDNVKGASDSDVRLASADTGFRRPSDSDVTLVKDDTADHGILTPGSSGSGLRGSPLLGSSAEVPASQSDSDFDLNPSSELIDALQPDSGSDFELTALDASDEFEATPLKAERLGRHRGRPQHLGDQPVAAERFGDQPPGRLGARAGPGRFDRAGAAERRGDPDEAVQAVAGQAVEPKKSLSATPPPAAKKGEKDIFDDTDFEVDVPLSDDDSDDKTMQLEAASDFELEESDSASEVFAIDEEAVDQNAATAMAPAAFAEDEDEEDDGFESAVSSEMATAWSSSDSTSAGVERSGPAVVLSRDAEAEWGGLWVGLLSVDHRCSCSWSASSRSTWRGTSTSSATAGRPPGWSRPSPGSSAADRIAPPDDRAGRRESIPGRHDPSGRRPLPLRATGRLDSTEARGGSGVSGSRKEAGCMVAVVRSRWTVRLGSCPSSSRGPSPAARWSRAIGSRSRSGSPRSLRTENARLKDEVVGPAGPESGPSPIAPSTICAA